MTHLETKLLEDSESSREPIYRNSIFAIDFNSSSEGIGASLAETYKFGLKTPVVRLLMA